MKPASDEAPRALGPITSLISKSAKAQRKLTPGTWQHTMLRDNLRALRLAVALMTGRRPRDAGFRARRSFAPPSPRWPR
jgi:hypothetical protein